MMDPLAATRNGTFTRRFALIAVGGLMLISFQARSANADEPSTKEIRALVVAIQLILKLEDPCVQADTLGRLTVRLSVLNASEKEPLAEVTNYVATVTEVLADCAKQAKAVSEKSKDGGGVETGGGFHAMSVPPETDAAAAKELLTALKGGKDLTPTQEISLRYILFKDAEKNGLEIADPKRALEKFLKEADPKKVQPEGGPGG